MKYFIIVVLAFAAAQAQASSVAAESSRSNWLLAASGKHVGLSLNDATEHVQKRTGGRVLAAQEVREQGRAMYRVKIITPQGEVRIVLVDAQTGSVE